MVQPIQYANQPLKREALRKVGRLPDPGEGRGRPVEGRILQGSQHAARIQEQLLPARTAGRMVPALQTHVAVVPDRRPSTELARPIHWGNDSDCLADCHRNPAPPPPDLAESARFSYTLKSDVSEDLMRMLGRGLLLL